MRLKDKVAIITGGSRGIGFATADKFLKEGASVVLAASSQESADVAVDKLKEKYPNAIVAGISPNLASMESVRKAFKEATEKYGCVDILVNNAGISENTSFMDYTEETFDKVMDLNVKGVFNTTRVAAECMVARGKGVILSTSSMVSISGQPSGFAYPASKFAVNGLTVSLARELGPNIAKGTLKQWHLEDMDKISRDKSVVLLDVRTVRLKDTVTGEENIIECDGLFVSIGRKPTTDFLDNQIELDNKGYIVAGENTETSIPGVYAVGDVRTKLLRQIVTAVADGAMAVHMAEEYMEK